MKNMTRPKGYQVTSIRCTMSAVLSLYWIGNKLLLLLLLSQYKQSVHYTSEGAINLKIGIYPCLENLLKDVLTPDRNQEQTLRALG